MIRTFCRGAGRESLVTAVTRMLTLPGLRIAGTGVLLLMLMPGAVARGADAPNSELTAEQQAIDDRARQRVVDVLLPAIKLFAVEKKVDEAIRTAEPVFAMEAEFTGSHDPPYGYVFYWMIDSLEQTENYGIAAQMGELAVAVLANRYGAQDWRVANAHWRQTMSALLAEMEESSRKLLAQYYELAGELNAFYQAGDGAQAVERGVEALALLDRIKLATPHPLRATALTNLALARQVNGELAETRKLSEQALAMYQTLYPADELPAGHPSLGSAHQQLGEVLGAQGAYADANREFELAIRQFEQLYPEKLYPRGHRNLALAVGAQAYMFDEAGNLPAATDGYRRAFELLSKLYPDEEYPHGGHPEVATALSELGIVLWRRGRFELARVVYEDALRRRLAIYSPDKFPDGHEQLATIYNNLGSLMRDLGNDAAAADYFQHALDMYRRLFPREQFPAGHLLLATGLNNLATARLEQGAPEDAYQLFLEAHQMLTRLYPPERFPTGHTALASSMNNVGTTLSRLKRYQEALPWFERSLAMEQALFPEAEFPQGSAPVAASYNNLGAALEDAGNLDGARKYYELSLAMRERVFSPEAYPEGHPALALSYSNLALLDARQGDDARALQRLSRALEISQASIVNVFDQTSEGEMSAYLGTSNARYYTLLSIVDRMARNDAATSATATGLRWLLERKTIVAESVLRFRALERLEHADPEVTALLARRRQMRQQLAALSVNPPREWSKDQVAATRERLLVDAQRIEVDLKRRLSSTMKDRDAGRNASTQGVGETLAAEEALVEIVRFVPRNLKGEREIWQPPRYAAVVARAGGRANWVDLGPADELDGLAGRLRDEVEMFRRQQATADAATERAAEVEFVARSQELAARLFEPLRPHLEGVRNVYVAPDGELSRVAFEALVDRRNRYLIEDYRFVYLASGRDLLRPHEPPAQGSVVFAAPDYDLADDQAERVAQLAREAPDKPLETAELPDREAVEELTRASSAGAWKVLPGMAEEARKIEALFRRVPGFTPVRILTGADALEGLLKRMPPPRLLHLATHGFYLKDRSEADLPADAGSASDRAGRGLAVLASLSRQHNPLLRCGVVLAGANRLAERTADMPADSENLVRSAPGDDGWLMAEEIGLLDLRGCELVVLSACETGLGDWRVGEGVAGLRQAFLLAGAETLVTSLYKVPDRETNELMQDFYSRLAAGTGRAEALSSAQRALLARRRQARGAAHPFYWASFVLVGAPD
ncbi:MAG: CHAT domain-containing protein [Pirellulales bacterium]|nr:CHAT domain-containing protein [Pirellulales bacterium]